MWAKTNDTLLIVEPGTPSGYQRILDARAQLIKNGAHVIAPCPHDDACPLVKPDWCHFSQRLQRSRVHKQLKSAELPYEDEKFIYVALSRAPVAQRPVARACAAVNDEDRDHGKTLHKCRRYRRKRTAPRQGEVCKVPQARLGRCGTCPFDSPEHHPLLFLYYSPRGE